MASDETAAFLNGHTPEPVAPPAPGRAVECRALVPCEPRGRPKLEPTPEITEAICDMLREGKHVREIGKSGVKDIPSTATIRRWIESNEEFRQAYLRAKESYCEDVLDQVIEIADDKSEDVELVESADGMPTVRVNKTAIGRSELQIKTRFETLAKRMPRKYGDPAQIDLAPPVPAETARNGDDAKVIDGEVIPLENHPLYDSILAWGRVAKEAKR